MVLENYHPKLRLYEDLIKSDNIFANGFLLNHLHPTMRCDDAPINA